MHKFVVMPVMPTIRDVVRQIKPVAVTKIKYVAERKRRVVAICVVKFATMRGRDVVLI